MPKECSAERRPQTPSHLKLLRFQPALNVVEALVHFLEDVWEAHLKPEKQKVQIWKHCIKFCLPT